MKLYWKIFLAFWFSTVLMVLLAVITNHQLASYKETDHHSAIGKSLTRPFVLYKRIVRNLRKHDIENFQRWWQSHAASKVVTIYLADLQDRSLLDNKIPKQVTSLLAQFEKRSAPRKFHYRGKRLIGGLVNKVHGQSVKLIISMPSHRAKWQRFFQQNLWSRVIIGLLVSAVVCYLLARYITQPIHQLRSATAKLASGDLSARSGIQHEGSKDEIAQLARGFDFMATRLQQSTSAQQRLIKDVSHELRSPLARLQVALELARQRSNDSNLPELERIEKEADTLNHLIAQILVLPQLETESSELNDVIDLVALIEAIIQDAQFEAQRENKQILFNNTLQEALVNTRGDLLHSAIENVIRNAIRYTETGTQVQVSLLEDKSAQSYVVSIKDQGPGVIENELERIFDAFYRVSDSRDRHSGGHGLGLAIAERAVRRHNGEISAHNCAPGLEVRISLPIRFPQD